MGLASRALFSILAAGHANVAQLVEQLIRNQQVTGSSPVIGSSEDHCKNNGFQKNKGPRRFIRRGPFTYSGHIPPHARPG